MNSVLGEPEVHEAVRRPGLRAWSVTLVVLCQSMQSLAYGGLALFLPLIRRDIGLTFTQAGAIAGATLLAYAFMQVPAGYLADRFGPRRLFLAGLLGCNLLLFGLAHLASYEAILVNQVVSGFFRSLVFAPGLLLITALFPPTRRATAMGLYVAGGFSSSIFLNLLGPLLVGPLGWRNLFNVFAAAGGAVLLLYWRLGDRDPRAPAGERPPMRELVRLLRTRLMWLIAGIQYVRLAVVTGLGFWLPSLIVADKGASLQVAGLLVALGSAIAVPSNLLGGYLSDRLQRPLMVVGASLFMLALTTFLLARVEQLLLVVIVVGLNSVFLQLYFGPLFSVPIELFGQRTAGVASGFGNFFANLGGLTFAYLMGAVKDATGSFAAGLEALAALCLLGLGCTILLARARRPASGQPLS